MTAPNFFSKRARREVADATKVAPKDEPQPMPPVENKLQQLKEDVKLYQETTQRKRV